MVIEICKNLCTLCPLYCPDQGDIVGREYINFYKFLLPYGISLRDSTIVYQLWWTLCIKLQIMTCDEPLSVEDLQKVEKNVYCNFRDADFFNKSIMCVYVSVIEHPGRVKHFYWMQKTCYP
jgi:hypothetical protein